MPLHRESRGRVALVADGLTAARLALAIPLFATVAAGRYAVAAIVLIAAWWTDFFDGRLARTVPGETRLGAWDPYADAAVAAAILAGLVAVGVVSATPWAAAGAVLAFAFLLSGNLAWCMLLQALAYELFLAWLWVESPGWLLVPAATVLVLLVANRRRFFGELLPTFFSGIGAHRLGSAPAWNRWR